MTDSATPTPAEPTKPTQTIIPEVAEHIKSVPKPPQQIVITISFDEINKAIEMFRKGKQVIFNPQRMSYYVDGSEISCQFLTETIEKFSHYINAACYMMKNSKQMAPNSTIRTLKKMDDTLKDITKDAEIQ